MSYAIRRTGSLFDLGDLSRGARRVVVWGALGVAFATAALLVLTDGNIAAALAPALFLVVAFVLVRLPVGALGALFLFACLLFDNPAEGPGMGIFKTVLQPPGALIYNALEKTLGVPGLKVFGIEVLLIGLLVAALVARGRKDDELPRAPRPFVVAGLVTLGAVIFLEVYGIARGGNVRFSMLQFRPLLFVAAFPLVYAMCARSPRQVPVMLTTMVAVAFIRAAFGIVAWLSVLRFGVRGSTGLGGGSYVMTHSDSILFAVALTILACWVILSPSLKSIGVSSIAGSVILYGMIINNRRIAFVSLAGGLALLFLFGDPVYRRRVTRLIRLAIPVGVLYILVGWSSTAGWAKPVQMVKSVFEGSDNSAQTRDIENYNLVVTMRQAPLLGSGFGHEYVEESVAYSISHAFEAYRYVPHNSILWLFSAGGVVGYTAFFALPFVVLFAAFRLSRRRGITLEERLLVCSVVGTSVAYGMQAYGDMGLGSWMGGLIVGAHFGVLGNRAGAHGVFDRAPRDEAGPLPDDAARARPPAPQVVVEVTS